MLFGSVSICVNGVCMNSINSICVNGVCLNSINSIYVV